MSYISKNIAIVCMSLDWEGLIGGPTGRLSLKVVSEKRGQYKRRRDTTPEGGQMHTVKGEKMPRMT